ncbi:helix-turn-helix domain-containing protein [Leuconostoc falkenbergense]|jgi:transcriptional regulator with XRE-family HTH domain|uniref:helix-turn-helix domain-containing protein n=1 Tax=Leuconostoc falkenbergense TaxID=2766470 RepID=UPI002A827F0D|nr:helix-turn-helix domain-containing protein [Leuconostoc falkenbergense]MDY5163289.1 helix-turn-helix domain-containing protein [Leuconostoc falkenbergense]
MTLFERTKNLSKQKGWNLQTTAEKAGLSQNAIYNWKTKEPSKVSLKAVADVLGVSSDYLLGKTNILNDNKNEIDLKEARHEILSYGGKPISDEDWAVIKRILESGISE